MEKHHGSIKVEFDGMPSILLESYKPHGKSNLFQRLSVATRRRRFSLAAPWNLALNDIGYDSDLNGTIDIPVNDAKGQRIVFDGATIPVPWLVSLLTIGILRPLGVVLIGSIVHDYAYQFGHLRVRSKSQEIVKVPLERHTADKLFRDIIGTVNRLPPVGYIAWMAVRIGWLWVPYSGKRWTGRPPIKEYLSIALLGLVLFGFAGLIGAKLMCTLLFVLYLAAYLLSKWSHSTRYSD